MGWPLATGVAFLPMMLIGAILTPFAARLVERIGARPPIVTGLALMAAGAIALASMPPSTPVWVLAVLLVPVGLAGPLVVPATTAVLLESVPAHRAGTASGVFNTSRQLGGALAVAVFGSLLAGPAGLGHGLRVSLVIAAAVAIVTAVAALWLRVTPRDSANHLDGVEV